MKLRMRERVSGVAPEVGHAAQRTGVIHSDEREKDLEAGVGDGGDGDGGRVTNKGEGRGVLPLAPRQAGFCVRDVTASLSLSLQPSSSLTAGGAGNRDTAVPARRLTRHMTVIETAVRLQLVTPIPTH